MTTRKALLSSVLPAFLLSGCVVVIDAPSKSVSLAKLGDPSLQTCQTAHTVPDTGNLQVRGSAGGVGVTSAGSMIAMKLGMGIGPGMALDERHALNDQVQTFLETASDGSQTRFVTPKTGRSITLRPSETQTEFRRITVARGEEVGRLPESFVVEPGRYVTRRATTLRPTPSSTARIGDGPVPEGVEVEIMGRVRGIGGDSWLLTRGLNGAAYGYIDPADLMPLSQVEFKPVRYNPTTGTVLRDPVNAHVQCRTLNFETAVGQDLFRTCRGADGIWISQPPSGDKIGACAPVNAPYLLDNRL